MDLSYNKEIMQTFDIINPATSAVLDRAPDATVDDAKQAIEQIRRRVRLVESEDRVRALGDPAQVVRADPPGRRRRSRA